MKTKYLWLLALIGVILIGIGIYTITKKDAPKDTAAEDSISVPVQDEQPGWKEVKQGALQVNQQWTSVGSYSGKILIVMSGQVTLDPGRPPITPDGISEVAPQGFTVPGIVQYCSIAKANGRILKVGSRRELEVNGELYLGPNEDAQAMHGNSFADNSGAWTYKIFTKQQG